MNLMKIVLFVLRVLYFIASSVVLPLKKNSFLFFFFLFVWCVVYFLVSIVVSLMTNWDPCPRGRSAATELGMLINYA